ncbi:MAG TPA: PadR family transcriptional regulator [Vicinamibacterales bacterium]|nr:PadR family transcriptional regulator [Vicinamibacterales bacterium]
MLRIVTRGPTLLEFAILGHLQREPMSGYALRKLFATTAMAHYSDSPGSIYPALARLKRNGLVTATVQKKQTLRPRQVYRLTGEGLRTLERWVSAPVTREEVVAGRGSVMLRFVFAEQVLGAAAAVRLLESLERVLAAYVPELEQSYETLRTKMPVGARLALRNGIDTCAAQLRWTGEALRQFRRLAGRKETQ